MIEIRDCAEADGEALFGLFGHWDRSKAFERGAFFESLAGILAGSTDRILLAVSDGAILGYAQIMERRKLGNARLLEVEQLLVDDGKRSCGVGKALMEKIEDIARERGIGTIALSSQVHRSRAHVFYERLGYVQKKVSKYYEKRIE